MQNAPEDPSVYSDPSRVLSLPFLSQIRRSDRFNLSSTYSFSFMGRESFREVWATIMKVEKKRLHIGAIYVYGSMGFGKSHILAALVCALTRQNRQVIYIPHCGEAYRDPQYHMERAFLFAFADSPSDVKCISQWKNFDDIIVFCRSKNRLYFVIDQENALDPDEESKDMDNARKLAFLELIQRCTTGHITITSATANVNSYKKTKRIRTNDAKVFLIGGMTRVCDLGCTC